MNEKLTHPFGPVIYPDSEILILGSFPSPKSREVGFYYGHPSNRFWPVLAAVYGEAVPSSIDAKKAFLRKHKLALYDAVDSCIAPSASDSAIREAVPSDIAALVNGTKIRLVLCNGSLAYSLYARKPVSTIGFRKMPSTSAANAQMSFQRLMLHYSESLLDK